MRAVVVHEYGGPFETERRPVPEPGPGQVRVAVTAAGLNFADVEQHRGDYPRGPTPPFVPGMEVAGRVDAVGDAVDDVPDGLVAGFCRGGFAEYAVVEADRLIPVPDRLDATAAAALPVQWVTAHNCLHEWGDLADDECVLVHAAAGGVGSAAVQLASRAGATVVGTASTAGKLALARELGADHGVNYEREDVADRVAALVDGVDLVLDGVGGRAFSESVAALADGGRIVTYGTASGRPGTVATPRLFFTNASVVGYHLGHALETTPERALRATEPLVDLFADGTVRVHVDSVHPLSASGLDRAYRRLRDRESRGKVVVEL
ncbi:NADPH:quinone reductase [Halobacteriales archaeon SW_5_70_135]|nr:MAG: NADPH:quinone reductase [Halobacteriales archaeon SW_5_70_135]